MASIKEILRHQYPDQYEELHEQTAKLISDFIGTVNRDDIAIRVLPEIIARSGQMKYGYGGADNILYDECRLAYKIADAMIEAR